MMMMAMIGVTVKIYHKFDYQWHLRTSLGMIGEVKKIARWIIPKTETIRSSSQWSPKSYDHQHHYLNHRHHSQMIWLGLDCAAVAPFLAASPGKNGAWAQKENILPQYHLWQCLFYLNWIDEAKANVEETHGGHHYQGSMFHLSFFE